MGFDRASANLDVLLVIGCEHAADIMLLAVPDDPVGAGQAVRVARCGRGLADGLVAGDGAMKWTTQRTVNLTARHVARLVGGLVYRIEEHVSGPAARWALLKQALLRVGRMPRGWKRGCADRTST